MSMKTLVMVAAMSCASASLVIAQARANWNNAGGDAQHTGWERTDPRISKDTVKDLQLLWKMKLETQPKGPRPLQPPALLGNLISYRGFKELAFVASSSDVIYAIDADLGKMFWQKHLEYANLDPQNNASSWACPGGLTAMPAMPPPAARGPAGGGGGAAAARGPAPAGAPTGPALVPAPAPPPARGPFAPFGVASVYAISSDGRLHRLNVSTGDDVIQPVGVLPANARVQSLTIDRNVIYTVTGQDCNGAPNAVWAIDLTADPPKAASFPLKNSDAWALGGPTIGMDGTVYVQTSDRLLALASKDLRLKESFATGTAKKDPDLNAASPLVFPYKDGEFIVAVGRDSRLHLIDTNSVVSADAPTKSLYDTPPVASAQGGIWGGLSSWQDMDGTRWVLAPVWGALNPELKIPGANPASAGSIVAFKVEDQNGAPVLTPVWASRDMSSPEPPVIASGVVFALSSGEFTRAMTRSGERSGEIDERPKRGTRAILYALDAATGKELYSSRNQIAGPAALTGLTLANGRVYFGTMDGTVYGFGMYMEH
jgi:outer membrane protein assembly factor BamB